MTKCVIHMLVMGLDGSCAARSPRDTRGDDGDPISGSLQSAQPRRHFRDFLQADIGEGQAQMPLLPRTEKWTHERQQSLPGRQRLAHLCRIAFAWWNPYVSEICAQRVDTPVFQLADTVSENARALGDQRAIAGLPVVQVVDGPCEARQWASGWADLHGVE